MSFNLVVEDDQGQRNVVPVRLGEIHIGRNDDNEVTLAERNVSRRHARIFNDAGAVYLEDLNSYNGIFLNGERIDGQDEVRAGDRLQIGDFVLELVGEGLAERRSEVTKKTAVTLEAEEETRPDFRLGDDALLEGLTPPPAQLRHAKPGAKSLDEDTQKTHEATSIIHMDEIDAGGGRPKTRSLAGSVAKMIVVSGNEAGREYEIRTSEVGIGRLDSNDLVLNHRSVSGEHCRISVDASNRFTLFDLGSANGTLLNGEAYARSVLKHGDLIEVGHVRIRFVPPGAVYTLNSLEEETVAANGGTPVASSAPQKSNSKLLIVSLAVFVFVLVALFLLLREPANGTALHEDGDALVEAAQVPRGGDTQEAWPEVAVRAESEGAFEDLRKHAAARLKIDTNDSAAKAYLARAKDELAGKKKLEVAREHVVAERWNDAWLVIAEVSPGTDAADDAEKLREMVRPALISQRIAETTDAIGDGDIGRAEDRIFDIQTLDAEHPELSGLKRRVAAVRRAAEEPAPRERKPKERVVKKTSAPVKSPAPTKKPEVPEEKSPAKTVRSLYGQGAQALRAKDYKQAIEQFSECVKIDRRYALCYRALGVAYESAGNGKRAAYFYKKYLDLEPSSPDGEKLKQRIDMYK